jgi:hypothetical protein
MGPPQKQPALPNYHFTQTGEAYDYHKWVQDSNWVQGLEGNIDTAHVGFLHRTLDLSDTPRAVASFEAPTLQLFETEFGFVYGGRRTRKDESEYYWRVTPFVLPSFTSIPSPTWSGSGLFVIPRDDETSWWFVVQTPRPGAELPYITLQPGTWTQTRNRDNDYGLDRELQRTHNYTGIVTNRAQDAAVTESMGQIYDRGREHLGTSDTAIIFMRRYLLRLAAELQQGIEPPATANPDNFRARPVHAMSTEPELRSLWRAEREDYLREAVPAPTS